MIGLNERHNLHYATSNSAWRRDRPKRGPTRALIQPQALELAALRAIPQLGEAQGCWAQAEASVSRLLQALVNPAHQNGARGILDGPSKSLVGAFLVLHSHPVTVLPSLDLARAVESRITTPSVFVEICAVLLFLVQVQIAGTASASFVALQGNRSVLDKAMLYDRTSTTPVIVRSIKNINGTPYLAPFTCIRLVNGLNKGPTW